MLLWGVRISKISLASYTVRVKNDIDDNYVPLDNIDGYNADFLDFLIDYFGYRQREFFHDIKSRKMMTVINFSNGGRTLKGLLEEGAYGSLSNIRNQEDKTISYIKTKNDAIMPPFYFIMEIPRRFDEGVILIQRSKGQGCKNSLLKDLNDRIKQNFPSLSVELNRLVPKQFIKEQLSQNRITKLRFVSFDIPSDISDCLPGNIERESFAELILHAGRNKRIPLIGNLFKAIDDDIAISDVVEIPNFEY